MSFDVAIEAVGEDGTSGTPLSENSLVKSGSRIRLRVHPSRAAWVYAVLLDHERQASLLHPPRESLGPSGPAHRAVDAEVTIPEDRPEGLTLDGPQGTRELYVVVRDEPWGLMDGYVRRLAEADGPDRGTSLRLSILLRDRPTVTHHTWRAAGQGPNAPKVLHVEPIEPGIPVVGRVRLNVR